MEDGQMKSVIDLVSEWHKTKSISIANEVCGIIWEAMNADEPKLD